MAAKVAGAANLHYMFLADAHRRLSLTFVDPRLYAFTALCTRKIQCRDRQK